MGCGASDMRPPPPSLEKLQRGVAYHNAQQLLSLLAQPSTVAENLCVGVFGLRGAGKSTLLHSIRAHLSAPPGTSTCSVPLPPPTSCFQLFCGPVPSASAASGSGASLPPPPVHVLCVDTPGLPCGASVRAHLHAILPRLHRIVWVIDSAAAMPPRFEDCADPDVCGDEASNLQESIDALMDLWKEMQRSKASSASAAAAEIAAAAHPASSGREALGLLSAGRRSKTSRDLAAAAAAPDASSSLHIVCMQSSPSSSPFSPGSPPLAWDAASSPSSASAAGDIVAATRAHLARHLPPPNMVQVHVWNCASNDAARKDQLIQAILGPPSAAAASTAAGLLAAPAVGLSGGAAWGAVRGSGTASSIPPSASPSPSAPPGHHLLLDPQLLPGPTHSHHQHDHGQAHHAHFNQQLQPPPPALTLPDGAAKPFTLASPSGVHLVYPSPSASTSTIVASSN